ncbi:MAG: response regulator transcription factor [Rhizobacter sp.]|nr:response regulator transcription factor [Rhizobacter sp.]
MKLLLIEDNAALQASLKRSFERRGDHVTVCGDGDRALDRWRAAVPDVVLLDLSLPHVDGLTILTRARAEGLDTPVIVLTARSTVGDRVIGLDAGADDYLLKPFDLDELEARLRAVVRRRGEGAPAAPSFHGLSVDAPSGGIVHHGRHLDLTQRETALMRALLVRPGTAVAKERLFAQVFEHDSSASPSAVEVVAYRLRKKLAPLGVQIVTLRGLGYLLRGDDDELDAP